MKSSHKEIRLLKRNTSSKSHFPNVYKQNSNNNRKEILQQMKASNLLVTSISQKHIPESFKDRCLQKSSSVLLSAKPQERQHQLGQVNQYQYQYQKHFPKINNSYCHPRLLQLLELCNIKPKEEKLLKGQNQLIFERKHCKNISEVKDPKKILLMPSIHNKPKEIDTKRTNNNTQDIDIDKEACESLDSDRMELSFDIEKGKDLFYLESKSNDDYSISPSKKYEKNSSLLSMTTIFGYQNKGNLLSPNLLSGIKTNAQSIAREQDDVSHNNNDQENDNESNEILREKQEPNRIMQHNQTLSCFVNNLSCPTNTSNTSQCLPLVKQFNHNSSQTNFLLNKNRSSKHKTTKKTTTFKLKAKCTTSLHSHSKKVSKKRRSSSLLAPNLQPSNPYDIGIIFHSLNKYSYVIQLNQLTEWKLHEEAWDKLAQGKTIPQDYEQYLLPLNVKDTIISSFYYQKRKKSNKRNFKVKTALTNCFIYSLDHSHVKDFKKESTKWKNALKRVVDRWQMDHIASLLGNTTINEEVKMKIQHEAQIIVDYAQGLYKNIIDLMIEISRYKLKKKLDA